jgi:branched-chain amino acid transport system ATP-binding protein
MSATTVSARPAAIEARRVSKRFGGVVALSDVSLSVDSGEICGLIGPNGAGKTTLFDIFSGVQPATTGSVLLDDVDIAHRSPTWRARHGIRRTFQRQQPFGWLSVADNLLVATEWRGGGGGTTADLLKLPGRRRRETVRREQIAETLELLGIGHLAGQLAATLTIGQARLLEMGRAIVDRPRALLLDEPTSGLPSGETELLADAIRRVRTEHGCAVVLVEHDVGFVMGICDRIAVLRLGEILTVGTPEAVRADPAVAQAYLGTDG